MRIGLLTFFVLLPLTDAFATRDPVCRAQYLNLGTLIAGSSDNKDIFPAMLDLLEALPVGYYQARMYGKVGSHRVALGRNFNTETWNMSVSLIDGTYRIRATKPGIERYPPSIEFSIERNNSRSLTSNLIFRHNTVEEVPLVDGDQRLINELLVSAKGSAGPRSTVVIYPKLGRGFFAGGSVKGDRIGDLYIRRGRWPFQDYASLSSIELVPDMKYYDVDVIEGHPEPIQDFLAGVLRKISNTHLVYLNRDHQHATVMADADELQALRYLLEGVAVITERSGAPQFEPISGDNVPDVEASVDIAVEQLDAQTEGDESAVPAHATSKP